MQDTVSETGAQLAELDLPDPAEVPGHFWAVAAVGLLWNGFGAVDYTMTKLRNPDWIAQIDPAVLARIDAAPVWATAAWALGVWGSFVGAALLLARSRHAVAAFMVSFVAAIVSFGWQFSVGVVSTPILPAVIIAVVAFFWWYAAQMRERGALR